MEGIRFVRDVHLVIDEGVYLPRADLLGHVESYLNEKLFARPQLKNFVPSLLDVDLFVTWDGDLFILFVSPEKRAHLPARGMSTKHLSAEREAGRGMFVGHSGILDISREQATVATFAQLGFAPGFAAVGIFPTSSYTDEAKAVRATTGNDVADLIMKWAEARHRDVENSRVFLSHKGINKPLIEKIDHALRMLNVRTWFDRDDLAAGDPLVRGVDNAFSSCAAAVFFISADFLDAGVIAREIDRAAHEEAIRNGDFKIIPLVLAQHGGLDDQVPAPLTKLVWKTVEDSEIVPAIVRALPPRVQDLIKYVPLK